MFIKCVLVEVLIKANFENELISFKFKENVNLNLDI